jgi:hypothetical protein
MMTNLLEQLNDKGEVKFYTDERDLISMAFPILFLTFFALGGVYMGIKHANVFGFIIGLPTTGYLFYLLRFRITSITCKKDHFIVQRANSVNLLFNYEDIIEHGALRARFGHYYFIQVMSQGKSIKFLLPITSIKHSLELKTFFMSIIEQP